MNCLMQKIVIGKMIVANLLSYIPLVFLTPRDSIKNADELLKFDSSQIFTSE